MTERSASGHLAEICFAPRPRSYRRTQIAAIAAIRVRWAIMPLVEISSVPYMGGPPGR